MIDNLNWIQKNDRVFLELDQLSVIMTDSLTIRRSSSNPMLASSGSRVLEPKAITKKDFKHSLFSGRSAILASLLLLSLSLGYMTQIYVYSQFQNNRAIPDIISDIYKPFPQIKTSIKLLSTPLLPVIASFILILIITYFTFKCFNLTNYRKFILLLSFSSLFFSLCNMSTQLPVPCYGTYGCTCETKLYQEVRKSHSLFSMFLTYFFTLGLGTSPIPACGSYMNSAIVTFQWNLGLFICDIISKYKPEAKTFSNVSIRLFLTIGICFEILLRNTYTVSCVVPVIFVEMIWYLFSECQEIYMKGYVPFTASKLGKIFGYFEEELTHEE